MDDTGAETGYPAGQSPDNGPQLQEFKPELTLPKELIPNLVEIFYSKEPSALFENFKGYPEEGKEPAVRALGYDLQIAMLQYQLGQLKESEESEEFKNLPEEDENKQWLAAQIKATEERLGNLQAEREKKIGNSEKQPNEIVKLAEAWAPSEEKENATKNPLSVIEPVIRRAVQDQEARKDFIETLKAWGLPEEEAEEVEKILSTVEEELKNAARKGEGEMKKAIRKALGQQLIRRLKEKGGVIAGIGILILLVYLWQARKAAS